MVFADQPSYVHAALVATRARLTGPHDDGDRAIHDLARQAAAAGASIPLLRLRERLRLSPTEELVLWVLLAHELDLDARRRIRELNTEQLSDPTLDTIRRAVYGDGPSPAAGLELAAEGTLRRFELIQRTDGDERAPEHRQTFSIARRVLALAHGTLELDPALGELATLVMPAMELGALAIAPGCVAQLRRAIGQPSGIVAVSGLAGSGRRSALHAVAAENGMRAMQIDGRRIELTRPGAQRQLRMIGRECRLLGVVPLIRHLDALAGHGEVVDRIELVETELDGLVLATCARGIARSWRRAPTMIAVPPPSTADRARLWERAVPQASTADAELLATMYPLAPAMIVAAGTIAQREAGDDPMTPMHLREGVCAVLDDRLAGLASRLTITQRWEDLVMPDEQQGMVAELIARIRRRALVYETWGFGAKIGKGLGVAALFSGPPGTGKTMAAGLIANDLGVELYQVDLSKIVSKWIGETERNLAALFDAAEAGHAIILFDEADALFGKRTEVKSSNDRHANTEVNFLLQRLESFTGVCILTTNHETAIDDAFRRRLAVHIRFALPEAGERRQLWEAMLPESAPVARGISYDVLAERFEMSGGNIRNAVLRAAFLAADSTGVIDQTLLMRAAHVEYEAMGKIVDTGVL